MNDLISRSSALFYAILGPVRYMNIKNERHGSNMIGE